MFKINLGYMWYQKSSKNTVTVSNKNLNSCQLKNLI